MYGFNIFLHKGGAVKAKLDINVDPAAPIGSVPPKDVEKQLKIAVKEDAGLKALGVDATADIVVTGRDLDVSSRSHVLFYGAFLDVSSFCRISSKVSKTRICNI